MFGSLHKIKNPQLSFLVSFDDEEELSEIIFLGLKRWLKFYLHQISHFLKKTSIVKLNLW
jgi:hypothetical protein